MTLCLNSPMSYPNHCFLSFFTFVHFWTISKYSGGKVLWSGYFMPPILFYYTTCKSYILSCPQTYDLTFLCKGKYFFLQEKTLETMKFICLLISRLEKGETSILNLHALIWLKTNFAILFLFFLNIFIYLFLEKGEGREKERERNINV